MIAIIIILQYSALSLFHYIVTDIISIMKSWILNVKKDIMWRKIFSNAW